MKPIKGSNSYVNGYYILYEENENNPELHRVKDDFLILVANEMNIVYDTNLVMYTIGTENYIFDTSTEESKLSNFVDYSIKNGDILGYQEGQYFLLDNRLEKSNPIGYDNVFYHHNGMFYFPHFDDNLRITHINVLDTKTGTENEILTNYDIETFRSMHGVYLAVQRDHSVLIGEIESEDSIHYQNYESSYFFDDYFTVKTNGYFKFFDYSLNPIFMNLDIVDVLNDNTVVIENDTYKLYHLENGEECRIESNRVTKFSNGFIAVYKDNEVDFYKEFEKLFSISIEKFPEYHMAFKTGNIIDVENDEYSVLFLDSSDFTDQEVSLITGHFSYNVFNDELVDVVVNYDDFSFIIVGLDGYVSKLYDLDGNLIYKRDNIE